MTDKRARIPYLARLHACCLVVTALLVQNCAADWMPLTGAENSPTVVEVHVERDSVLVKLEIHQDDTAAFEDLLTGSEIELRNPRKLEFAAPFELKAHDLVLQPERQSLTVQARTERRSNTQASNPVNSVLPYAAPPDDLPIVALALRYSLPSRVRSLVITPPLKTSGYPATNMGLIVFHEQVPVIDYRYLSGAETLTLDWDDPWYSKFANPNLSRHHRDPLMSFLYVEDLEVRHEIIARLRDVSEWAQLDLKPGTTLTGEASASVREAIGAFMLARNPATIDGKLARPILDRVNFVRADQNGIQILEDTASIDTDRALVGVIIAYIVDAIPQRVDIEWNLFNERIARIPVTQVDPAGRFQRFIDESQPVARWDNLLKRHQAVQLAPVLAANKSTLRIPVLSALLVIGVVALSITRPRSTVSIAAIALVLAIALRNQFVFEFHTSGNSAAIDEAQAQTLIASLLRNVYRAFDFRREEDIYDKLALSAQGDLLTRLYLDHRRSWVIAQQGGARARVEQLELTELSPNPSKPESLSYRIVWKAEGAVGHWGHVHQRANRYEANVELAVDNGYWKFADIDFLDEQRLDINSTSKPTSTP